MVSLDLGKRKSSLYYGLEVQSSKWTKRYKIHIAAFPENFADCVTPRRVRCVGQIDGEVMLVNFTCRHCFSFCNPKQRRSSREFTSLMFVFFISSPSRPTFGKGGTRLPVARSGEGTLPQPLQAWTPSPTIM
ncbi:hypothetical protein NL676_009986 [Syzygium grande]|nr:hypothetical protein NL676_009986 [Syzygium grande]